MNAFLATAIPELPWPAWLALSFLAGSVPFGLLIARAKGSISEKASGRKPNGCQATVAASIPEQTDR